MNAQGYVLERRYDQRYRGIRTFVNYILIVLLLLVEYKYFCLPANFDSIFVKYNIASNQQIKLLITLAMIINNAKYIKALYHDKIFRKIVMLILLLLLSAMTSVIMYGYSYVTIYKLVNILYFPCCLIGLLLYSKKVSNIFFMIKILTIINIVAGVIFALQAVVYNSSGSLFLNIYWYGEGGVYMRSGSIRITECMNMVALSYAISMCELINEKHKSFRIIHLLNVITSVIYLYFTYTRSVQLLCIIIAMVIFFIGYKADKKSKLLMKYFILAVALVVLATGFFSLLVDTLSVSTTEKSYVARVGAYAYYFKMFKAHIISGLGFVDFDNSPYFSLLHGSLGLYYPSDVGLVGTVINYGVFVGLWYLMVIISAVKTWISNKECTFLLVIVIILLYTSFTLSMLDNGRFSMFAIILLLGEYAVKYMETATKGKIKLKKHHFTTLQINPLLLNHLF